MNEIADMVPEISAVVAALGGSGIASGLAQYFVKRSINQLESIPLKLQEIKSELDVIKHKVGSVESLRSELKDQDKRLYLMEMKGQQGRADRGRYR